MLPAGRWGPRLLGRLWGPARCTFRIAGPRFDAPHTVLGVAVDATQDQVRQAFLGLAKKYHPDVNPGPGAHEEFVRVQTAYLKMSKNGSSEEESTKSPPRSDTRPDSSYWGFEEPRNQWNYNSWSSSTRKRGQRKRPWDSDFDEDAFDDEDSYDWQNAPPHSQTTRKVHRVTLSLSLVEAILGCKKVIDLPGEGPNHRLEVRISPGMCSNDEVRIESPGRSPVVLIVRVKVQGEGTFRTRGGLDVEVSVPISLVQAILGAQVQVPLPSGGSVAVEVPPGTRPGDTAVLKGQGLRSLSYRARGAGAGALHVAWAIQIPERASLTARQRAALQHFAEDERVDNKPLQQPLYDARDHRPKHRKEKSRQRHYTPDF